MCNIYTSCSIDLLTTEYIPSKSSKYNETECFIKEKKREMFHKLIIKYLYGLCNIKYY